MVGQAGLAEETVKTFDVVAPSLPGFGFSDPKAMSIEAMAHKYPDAVQAIHITDVGYPTGQEDFSTFSPAEREFAMNDSPAGWAAWVMSFVCTGIPPPTARRWSSGSGGMNCSPTSPSSG